MAWSWAQLCMCVCVVAEGAMIICVKVHVCRRLRTERSLCFAPLSQGGSWFLARMTNIVLLKTLKSNTTISDCPQPIPWRWALSTWTLALVVVLVVLLLFTVGRAVLEFLSGARAIWHFPLSLYVITMATVSIILNHFNVQWHVFNNDAIHFDICCQSDISARAGARCHEADVSLQKVAKGQRF